MGFKNGRLWASFFYFVLLAVSQQQGAMVPKLLKRTLDACLQTQGWHVDLVKHAPIVGGGPMSLDSCCRARSQRAVRMYAQIYPDTSPCAATLAGWMLLLCVYRYCGAPRVIDDVLLLCGRVPELMRQGLTTENADAIVAGLTQALLDNVGLRTTLTAFFDGGDGRRGLFPRRVKEVPVLAPCKPQLASTQRPWLARRPLTKHAA